MLNLIRSTCRRVCGSVFKYRPAIPGICKRSFEKSCAFTRKIEQYPLTIKYALLFSLASCGVVIYFLGPKRINCKLVKRLRNGSDPKHTKLSLQHELIDRSDVVKSIQKLLFESDPDNGKIGIILGPKGSGKSSAVIKACSDPPGPKYILYQEIYQTSDFARQLAHAAAIPLSRNIFDSVFSSLGLDSQFYYFPKDPIQAINYVMNKVARRSKEEFKKQNIQLNYLPCFVIDAAELLAVYDPRIFDPLLLLAQHYIRLKKLRIVLVDSDGIALSKVNKILKHPQIDIVEVKDLVDKDAEDYLVKQTRMSRGLAKRLIGLIGGRLIHLIHAVDAYQKLDSNANEDLAYKSIKEHLFVKIIAPVNNVIIDSAPLSELIVKCIISHDSKPLFPSELKVYLKSNLKEEETNYNPAEAQKVIDALVNVNALRYNAEEKLVWHSRFVEAEMKAQYPKYGYWVFCSIHY